ncbi:MAG: hypothetical protein M5U12_11495 [Verrucomicrobia bacterium]|nr:hypothetical protein [Verrucomicrobiota bacterium]
MKTRILITAALMLAWATSAADRPCAPLPIYTPPYATCFVTNYWAQPVDLDGDGVAEFSHERNRAEHRIDYPDFEGRPGGWYYQDDEIEAYYPEAHVQLYVRTWGPGNISMLDPKLAVGQIIEPDPPALAKPYWCWGGACSTFALEALGVGIVSRISRSYPCPPDDGICWGGGTMGFLKPDVFAQPQEGFFGMRLQRADGWHLGWIRLKWTWEFEWDPPWGRLELLGVAIHPEPEKAIQAGEPARPELATRREGEEIVLSWATVWTGYTLERSPALGQPTWEAVPGVSANAIRLPRSDAPAFFRLRR